MAEEYSAGTVFLQVVPSYRGLQESIRRKVGDIDKDLAAGMEKAGEKAGKSAGDALGKEIGKGAKKAGEDYAGAFQASFKRSLERAQKELKPIRLRVDDNDARDKIDDLLGRIEMLRDANIGIDVTGEEAIAELRRVEDAFEDLRRNRTIDVDFDFGHAIRGIQVLRRSVEKEFEVEVDVDLDKANSKIDAWTRDFRSKITKALDAIGNSPGLDKVGDRLRALQDARIDIDISAAEAENELRSIAADAKIVGAMSPDIRVETNAKKVAAELGLVATAANRAEGAGGGFGGMLRRLSSDSDNAGNSMRLFNGWMLALSTVGPALIPMLAGVAGGILAIGTAASGAAGGLGVMLLGFSGIGEAVTSLGDVADETKEAGRAGSDAGKQVRSALQAVADAERSLARARQDAAQANQDAARDTVRAQQDAAQANQDAARATKDAQRDAAQANRDAAEDIVDAQEDAADANRDASREIVSAQRAAAEANRQAAQQVKDAQRQAADAVQEALRRQAQAERDYASAQRDAAAAQRDLIAAREEGRRQFDDVKDQQRQNALDERQAVIDLFNADVENTAARQDPGATNLEREQAAINLGNARERLHEIREEEKRLADERKKGIRGTEAVQTAQDALTDALEAQRVAHRAIGRAAADVDRARLEGARDVRAALAAQRRTAVEGAQAIAEAQRDAAQVARDGAEAVADAERAAARTRREGARSIQDALREQRRTAVDGSQAIADAERRQARTRRDGVLSVKDAQRNLVRAQRDYRDALKGTSRAGVSSMDDLRSAMSKLSPAGRRFARFLFSLRDEFYGLRRAAQEGMLPGVQNALSRVITKYGPAFTRYVRRMAETVGGLFRELGKRLTKGPFQGFFQMLDRTGPRLLRQFGRSMMNWGEVFASIFTILEPYALKAARMLLRLSRVANQFFQSKRGKSFITDFMDYAVSVMPKVIRFVRAAWGAFQNLAKALAPIGGFVLELLTGFLNFIAIIPTKALTALAAVIITIGAVSQATAAGVALYRGVMLAITGVTYAWTAAQWLFNAAMSANPLALVIKALMLVGAALVWAYHKFDWFKKFVDTVWDAIVKGAQWLWDVLFGHSIIPDIVKAFKAAWDVIAKVTTWLWQNVIKPVFNALKAFVSKVIIPVLKVYFTIWKAIFKGAAAVLSWVWKNVLRPTFRVIGAIIVWLWKNVAKPIWEAMKRGWRVWASVFKWVWQNILKPAFHAIAAIARWLWKNVLKPVWENMKRAWRDLLEAIQWVWRNVLKPVWNALAAAARWLWKNVLKPVWNNMQQAWRDLMEAMRWVWHNILKPTWNLLKAALQALWNRIIKPIFGFIKDRWKNMGDGIRWVWNNIIKPAWEALKDGLRAVRDTFKTVVRGIKTWWDKLINIAKAPVRFVVNTVINKGLIGSFNKIAEWLDIDKIDEIKLPKGFARGGIPSARDMSVYPGYTPGRDVGYIGISGGEGILRPEATRAVGAPVINAINSAAISGGVEGVKRYLGGYWKGGVLPTKMERISRHGAPNSYYGATAWDINGPGQDKGQKVRAFKRGRVADVNHWDYSYGNHVVIKHPQSRQETLYAHLKSTRVRPGQQVYAGQMIGKLGSSGKSSGPHLHFELDGGIRGPRERAGRGRGDATEHDPVDMYRLRRDARGYNGVKPHVAAVGDLAARLFGPFPGGIGGVGARSGPSDHPSGHALDFMTKRKSQGDALSDWLAKESKQLAVKYIIWRQRIKNPPKSPWDRMENRGDPTSNHMDHVHASFLKNAHPSFGRGVISGPGGGGGGGGLFSNLPAWLQAFASGATDWFGDKIAPMMSTLTDNFGGGSDSPYLGAVKAVPGKIISAMASYLMAKLPRGTRGGAASNFGPGPEGIFKSLMSTGYYTKRQAAGVLGNMHIESGFVPDIVQGGGHKRTPAGVGSGWGLVQWTPGSKIMPYLRRIGDYGVAGQVTALTQQLRGIGGLSEANAGSKLKQAKTPEKAAWAFGKYYERPASLSSTIAERRRVARALYEKYRDLNLGETNPQRPTRDRNRGNFANGGIVPGNNIYLRDKGGLLPPGISTVLNATGGHEKMAVFNDEQWRTLKSMGERGGSGITYAPTFEASDLTAGDVADDLLFTLRRVELGGVYTGADS